MTNEHVVQRLDVLIALLRLAHREEIERAREAIRGDKVNPAILDGAVDWVGAGRLNPPWRRRRGSLRKPWSVEWQICSSTACCGKRAAGRASSTGRPG